MAAPMQPVADVRKRSRDAWEPEAFRSMYENRPKFQFVKHVEAEGDNMI